MKELLYTAICAAMLLFAVAGGFDKLFFGSLTDAALAASVREQASAELGIPAEYRGAYGATVESNLFTGRRVVEVCYGIRDGQKFRVPLKYRSTGAQHCRTVVTDANPTDEEVRQRVATATEEIVAILKPFFVTGEVQQ